MVGLARFGSSDFGADACLEHLGRGGLGTVGLALSALPYAIPVRYVAEDRAFRIVLPGHTDVSKKLLSSVVALHADGFDDRVSRHWSAVAIGSVTPVPAPDRLAAGGRPPVVAGASHSPAVLLEPRVLLGHWLDWA
ncbi:MAG: pyridoxamine 5'-phosphate oxidase family protein [Acidobacteriota bacterium]|nr:pyridoxamine 5'-phosphate oxidase family protein [Acidobacteriota bacterium]